MKKFTFLLAILFAARAVIAMEPAQLASIKRGSIKFTEGSPMKKNIVNLSFNRYDKKILYNFSFDISEITGSENEKQLTKIVAESSAGIFCVPHENSEYDLFEKNNEVHEKVPEDIKNKMIYEMVKFIQNRKLEN